MLKVTRKFAETEKTIIFVVSIRKEVNMKILVSYIGKGKHLTFKNMPTNLMLEDYFRTQKNRKNKSFIIVTKKRKL